MMRAELAKGAKGNLPKLYAVIGVRFDHGKTFYVKRSPNMKNYPNTWSLFSIQFNPDQVDYRNLKQVQSLMDKMSEERFGGGAIKVLNYLDSGTCSSNPINKRVFLHMYLVDLEKEPMLNPDYYADSEWLTPQEYVERSKEAPCGLCTRMWSDYSYTHGLSKERFAPMVTEDIDLFLKEVY